MPLELQVIRASEFIRLDVRARLDFEASKKALQALVLACRKRGLNRALLDVRSVPIANKPHFTLSELAGLVATFREAGFTREQRLALLYQTDPHRGIRTFTFLNRMRGLQVRPFTEFEEALEWLSEEQESREESEQAETPVQINQRTRKVRRLQVDSTASAPSRKPPGQFARQCDVQNRSTLRR